MKLSKSLLGKASVSLRHKDSQSSLLPKRFPLPPHPPYTKDSQVALAGFQNHFMVDAKQLPASAGKAHTSNNHE